MATKRRSLAKIERFVEQAEAKLAPPDRTKWLRLIVNPGDGETPESAIAAHLARHPEDAECIEWVRWIFRTGVPRRGGSVILAEAPALADPIGERTPADYQFANNAPALGAAPNEPVRVPLAPVVNQAPDAKPEPQPEPPPITPWGFGPRRAYDPFNDTW